MSPLSIPKSDKSWLVAAVFAGCLLLAGCGGQKEMEPTSGVADGTAPVSLSTVDQQVSYGIGRNVGMGIARQSGVEVDVAAFTEGLRDGLSGAPSKLDDAALQAAFAALEQRSESASAGAAETNLAAATAFLEQNRTRPGITTTGSGLQYEVIQSGNGAKPGRENKVKVHYHGTLIDGTVFDSSVQRGEPISFPVTGVIPGWVEALQLMSVGDKWRLFISPGLAYGARATGRIPPNSALIFEVELLGIE